MTALAKALLALLAIAAALTGPAAAQGSAPPPPDKDRCLLPVSSLPVPRVMRTADSGLKSDQARLTYVGHSTFLIESAGGLKMATDYNDYVRPPVVPDIITMNRAHSTHFSHAPDPRIAHVLRGWNPDGGDVRHDLRTGDVRVRNVPTNIRDWGGGTQMFGNSIFVFEMADICIVHLGHLHHTLTTKHLLALGQPDVLLVPVDGSMTLDLEGMFEVLEALNAPLMIPMHYFSSATLERFLARARQKWEVEISPTPTLTVSRTTLPRRQRVLVLPGS